ncbi:Shwachman-Bodian-diamond syndrome protein [Fomitiporia mediterranea MF3/22]|uniref:Shwachman-Bodian-diamond syndrome protein n=1 Tax=Fomitiporia mediterranea (strain MF3/22) TaxID=694068 RepID=UPI0004407B81|nr:Shwachman-Bodian-diamond syndrome protein [Fomitiporia mediterranea MF3/22]EJD04442.1 Shwachman-Bodian-diamond syndrome protein [Fomitiporia mediterranea MF3/22]
MPINQPSNQIKLTNVSVVRLKKGGKRFEVACYKNKVQEWRKGVETNLDDVLQISAVFVNVSKGEQAKAGDLKKAFGKASEDDIIKEILKHGDLQVGEKEREHELTNLRKDIAHRVSESVVDPSTQRPYSLGIIEKALSEVGFSVDPSKNAKSQVLGAIKLLQGGRLPVQRARMRVRLTIPAADVEKLEARIREGAEVVEDTEERNELWEVTLQIDPAQFRVYKELLDKECKLGRLNVVDQTVFAPPPAAT